MTTLTAPSINEKHFNPNQPSKPASAASKHSEERSRLEAAASEAASATGALREEAARRMEEAREDHKKRMEEGQNHFYFLAPLFGWMNWLFACV